MDHYTQEASYEAVIYPKLLFCLSSWSLRMLWSGGALLRATSLVRLSVCHNKEDEIRKKNGDKQQHRNIVDKVVSEVVNS